MSTHLPAVAAPDKPGPLLSVIVPALDPDRELRRCIDSIRVACADPAECEILIVVPSRQVEAARQTVPDERIVAETRQSIYAAMNDGIRASNGRYLYFMGKDDVVLPAFRDAVASLRASEPSALFFDVYWGTRGVYRSRPSRWFVLGRNICHQGIIYSRRVLDRHGPYVRKMRVQADHLMNLKLLWDAEMLRGVRYLPAPLAWYSGAGFSVATARDPVFWRLYPTIMNRYVGAWAACLLGLYRKLRGR